MNGLLIYLLEASAVTALLYACYFLLMRKETCFGLNRAILLLIAVCAFVVPLLPSPVPVPTTAHSPVAVATSEVGREPDAERKPEVFVAEETNRFSARNIRAPRARAVVGRLAPPRV